MQFLSGWTTLEALHSWQDVLTIAVAVFAILAATAGVLAYNAGKRADRIGGQRSWQGVLTIAVAVFAILAATAGVLAYNAGKKVDQFKDQEIQDLQGELFEATESFQVAEQQFKEATDELSKAESRISELEKNQEHRRITAEQKRKMMVFLSRMPPLELMIGCPSNNSEACDFASEFVEVFRKARWTVVLAMRVQAGPAPAPGVIVYINSEEVDAAPLAATIVQHTLQEAGFEGIGMSKASVSRGKVELFVGPKN